MTRFLAGFAASTVLWGAMAYLYLSGHLGSLRGDELADAGPTAEAVAEAAPPPPSKRRLRRIRRTRQGKVGASEAREATSGEDLGWDEERVVDMTGGEEQLSGPEIEAGFDSAMPKIRRCLVLVPAEGDVRGQLVFGMRVGADGVPKAVNLTGPAVVAGGESGSCLRNAAQGIRFATFQGSDMLFKYPITLQ